MTTGPAKDYASPFIEDGQTRAFYFKAVVGVHSEVRGKRRPMLVERRAEIRKKWASAKDPAQAERYLAMALKDYVVEWDVLDDKKQPVEINEKNILKVEPCLFQRLVDHTVWGEGCDIDPTLADEALREHDETMGISALSGKLPGDVELEGAQKN